MKFENKKGPKRRKKNHFVSWKIYFSSCHFFITINHHYNYNKIITNIYN